MKAKLHIKNLIKSKVYVFIPILVLLCIGNVRAQNTEVKFPKLNNNELSLNMLYSYFRFPEVTYERFLQDGTSLGFSLGVSVDDVYYHDFQFLSYYRLYFGGRTSGFFLEGHGMVFVPHEEVSKSHVGFGYGFAIGGKFVIKSGWSAELLLGLGNNIINIGDDYVSDYENNLYPRMGISIGRQF